MSEHEQPRDPAERDELLDANLERLLGRAQQRPEVPVDARGRMLARLRAAAAEPGEDSSPETEGEAARGPEDEAPRRGIVEPAANDGRGRRRAGVATALVAIAAALILAWVLGLGQRLLGDGDEGRLLAEHAHHELGARAISLADGSRALLRSGTELQELGPRHLRLVAGEVLLDVAEAVEPMLIETPQGRALVLGTRVLLRSEDAQTLAAVFHGSARVESEGAATELLLRAGEQALLRSATAPERIAGRRLSFEIDWARELLAPTRTPEPIRRGNLIARVPRWTGQLGPSPEWPLPMRELTVDVHVEDGHLRATIDQTFFNHLDRALEGVYRFPLPPEAAIARMAMYVDGERMEAGVVERDRGRDIYEQIVHRRRDPALLEWMQGNLFQVRIFPLPAQTEKRILLSYTAALDELYGEGELRVPIPKIDLPVAKVNYRIRVVGAGGRELRPRNHEFELRREGEDLIAEFEAADHRIGADIVATLAAGAPGVPAPKLEHHRQVDGQGRVHHGVSLRPDLRTELETLGAASTAAPARDWIVLFDSSASRGAGELEAQRQFLSELVAQLDGGDRLAVEVFDSRVRWFDAELRSVAGVDRKALETFVARESRVGLGLTDLGLALDQALERLAAAEAPEDDGRPRVPTLLYLGDGLGRDLGGVVDPGVYVDELADRLAGRASFVGVSFGEAYDEPTLERLAAAGAGLHLHVAEGDALPWRALELLTTLATPRVLELEASFVNGEGQVIAAEHTHASARSLADGERLELLTRLPKGAPEPAAIELRGRALLGGAGPDASAREWTHRVELPPPSDGARWLPRAWARAEVAALGEAGVEQNAAAITELGLAHFLVTPTTSLLVLENERMYRDFDVHRPAEDAWARYPAPDRIEVIREAERTEAGRGQYVVRSPLPVFDAHASNAPWSVQTRSRGRGPSRPLGAASFGGNFGTGGLGLVGTGRGDGGFGFGLAGKDSIGLGGSGTGAGFGGRGFLRDLADESKRSESKQTEFGGFVSRRSARTRWESDRQQARGLGPSVDVDARFASTIVTGASADSVHGAALDGLWPGSRPWPRALHYSGDWRLNDLGELVPALFEEPFDLAREELLLTGLDGVRGSISEPAAALIDAARAAQGEVRYALPEGGTLDIDADGRFVLDHARWGFFDERVIYDGETLRADYPELGLSVERAVGPTSPALLGEWVPWLVPEAEHLARFYDVVQTGPRTLKLTMIAGSERAAESEADERPWLEVELDAEHRVVALRMHLGQRLLSSTSFTWTDEGLELEGGRTLTRVGPASPITPDEAEPTLVALPLPSPTDLAVELEALEPGSAEWIAKQQQRLAGAAALAQHDEAHAILAALAEHGGRVLPGELALGGAALSRAPAPVRAAVLKAAGEGPVPAYLRAGLDASEGRITGLRKLAGDEQLTGTPVAFLAGYRTLLYEAEHRPGAASLRRLEAFLADYRHPTLGYVATSQLANRWWSKYQQQSRAWLALAEQDSRWKYLALHQAGVALYQRGRYDEAATVFERSFCEAEAEQTMPVVDWSVQGAMRSAGGQASWELAWARLRERVAESGDLGLALRLLLSAQQLGRADDAQRALDRLEPDEMQLDVALTVFDLFVAQGYMGEARAVLDSLRRRAGEAPEVLVRASIFAEQQGELEAAADALEGALDGALAGEGLTLDELRLNFARLFALRARLARPIANDELGAAAALAEALAVADRWRLADPDNPEIDRLCAELLWSLDHDEEAWRQLSSALDRHAAEGEALAWIADALERAGRLERAEQVWARAVAVEPTNAHHRLRRAQSLLANEREDEARVVLELLVEGDWQPRFDWEVEQGRQLLRSLERASP